MLSRPASPSHLRNPVGSMHSPSSYNPLVLQDSQVPSPADAMGRSHNSLDIFLPSDCLILRGTGVDVEPCMLRGNVVLNLAEATTFKEITMQLKGKSRVPHVQHDGSSILGGGYQTNVLYFHDWSFLEGELTHSPTLKAGRHVFPFQLQIEGHLPSSLSTHAGESAITYKLRATAVRPVFASNLHATAPVRIVRSFAPEALEYQQTLELENTWPEKMMYSLMVPHKAWAAGDTIKTLAKFSPLAKGVQITNITTTVQEYVKTFTRVGSPYETKRVIATATHEIRNGQAETVQLTDRARGAPTTSPHRPTPPLTAPSSPALSGTHAPLSEASFPSDQSSAVAQGALSSTPLRCATLTEGSERGMLGLSVGENEPTHPSPYPEDHLDIGDEEVVTTLPIYLPAHSTPSHSLEPITVTHRIRWTVSMTNLDSHLSELRCSLPLHVLDYALLEDARLATRATRRLLFGLDDAQPHDTLEELELPSYPAHILDCVPNAHHFSLSAVPTSSPRSMIRSESESSISDMVSLRSSLPHVSRPRDAPASAPAAPTRDEPSGAVALDRVNSELHRLRNRAWQRSTMNITTPPDSTQASRHASRASSRAASPERASGNGRERHHHHHHHSIFSLMPFVKVGSSLNPGQGKNHASSADNSASPSHCSSSGSTLLSSPSSSSTSDSAFLGRSASGPGSPVLPRRRSEEVHAAAAFSEVPDYDVASRGFFGGGVTPLSSTRGLPSYEEAGRSSSEGDLAARFAAAPSSSLIR